MVWRYENDRPTAILERITLDPEGATGQDEGPSDGGKKGQDSIEPTRLNLHFVVTSQPVRSCGMMSRNRNTATILGFPTAL